MTRRLRTIGLGVGVALLVIVATILGPALRGDRADEAPDEASPPASTARPSGASPTTVPDADPGAACIATWDVRPQVGQLVAIAVDGGALASEAQRVADLGLGGVLLQRPAAAGLAEGIAALKGVGVIRPLVMADEEGGEVQTLSDVLGPVPSPSRMAAAHDPAGAEEIVRRHAESVAALGIDVVLGPVVDVAAQSGGGPLAGRIFSADPAVVTEYGGAYMAAYEAAGVTTVLKHFPGHGSASGDSHEGPVSVPPLDALRARDLLPYDALLADAPAVMVGHVVVPDVTGLGPSSLSPEAIDGLLRDGYGYDGLVVTDSLSMGAIAFRTPPTDAAVQAIGAGADIALFVTIEDPGAVIDALVAAVERGGLDEGRVLDAVGHVLALKGIDPCAVPT